METLETWYTTLGVTPGVSHAELKHAYRTLAKAWHPDRFAADAAQQQEALEHFHRVTQAYRALYALSPVTEATYPATCRTRWISQRRVRWGVFLSIGALGLLSTLVWRAPAPQRLATVVRAVAASQPADLMPPRRTITVGSTKEEVRAIQGSPTVETERVWEYRGSRLIFQAGRVTGWDIWPTSPLEVHLLPTIALVPAPAYFTVGSTKEEVLTVQGTPTRLTEHLWEYGASRVFFTDNRVTRWDEWPGAPLIARLTDVTPAP